MGYRHIDESVVRALLGRWLGGESLRSIARGTGVDRKTVQRYVQVAQAVRLVEMSALDDETLSAIVRVVRRPADTVSEAQHVLARERERIRGWLSVRMSLSDVHAHLARVGVETSYATLRRFAIDACGWRVRPTAVRRAA